MPAACCSLTGVQQGMQLQIELPLEHAERFSCLVGQTQECDLPAGHCLFSMETACKGAEEELSRALMDGRVCNQHLDQRETASP